MNTSTRKLAVLGAGRQGVASAYDFARFGNADEIKIADISKEGAQKGADKVKALCPGANVTAHALDATDPVAVTMFLEDVDAAVSAIHYGFNPGITKAAIEAGCHVTDLGGNTDITREQLAMDEHAKEKGVRAVPDCGMAPGFNVGLAQAAMAQLDETRDVFIYCGGLTQTPKPPWNYECPFSIAGLTNEYDGVAQVVEDGKVKDVACFEELEELDFPDLPEPMKRLEAFITSGGLSTAPWTYEGRLNTLRYKTLRIPGHQARMKAYEELGLFGQEDIRVRGENVNPRRVFHELLESKVGGGRRVKDLGVIRARAVGTKNGAPAEHTVELMDFYDEETGLTAMERVTGWHASMVALYCLTDEAKPGCVPLAEAAPHEWLISEAKKRGLRIDGA